MSVPSQSSKVVGRGNGVVTSFPYSFKIPNSSVLAVTYTDASGNQTVLSPSQFSVSGLGSDTGGTVTYPLVGNPIASGTSITIARVLPLTQPSQFLNQGGYFPQSVEAALDWLEYQIQQVAQGAQNYPLAMTFPVVDVNPVTVLPPAAVRAGKYLGFDGAGNIVMSSSSAVPPDLSSFTVLATGSTTARSFGDRFADVVNVKDWGAKGDGSTDDTSAINAACASVGANGAIVFFPDGVYLTSGAIVPKSNTTLMGSGAGSVLQCTGAGWALSTPSNFGIVNFYNVTNVRVTNLMIYGTTTADQGHTPKLVYLQSVVGCTIDHCWLKNSAWEGVWVGGTEANTYNLIIEANQVDSVGAPAGTFVGLGALTINATDFVVSANRFTNCGIAVSCAGTRGAVVGNEINGFTLIGIATGDSSEDGAIAIVGNSITFTADPSIARAGIFLESSSDASPEHFTVVSGNYVRLIGNASYSTAACYRQTSGQYGHFSGNVAEISVRGVGFQTQSAPSRSNVTVFADNTVYLLSESGSSVGFNGFTSTGQTLTLRSSGNKVFGTTRANSSYAFDYNQNGGGTIDVIMSGDMTTEGNVRCGTLNYSASETDNIPLFESTHTNTTWTRKPYLTGVAFSSLGSPGNGTMVFCYDGTPGSNPLTSGGTGCLAVRQNGTWVAAS